MSRAVLCVLRIGHRIPRDNRVTTHVALVARAFGANEIWVDQKDSDLEARIDGVVERFGGSFRVRTGVRWRQAIRGWKGKVVHLTMYGERLDDVVKRIPKGNLLIIVGAGKVSGDVFEMADYNVAIGNQPHSEVAALAIFLDRLLEGEGLRRDLSGRLSVVPSPTGKVVKKDPT